MGQIIFFAENLKKGEGMPRHGGVRVGGRIIGHAFQVDVRVILGGVCSLLLQLFGCLLDQRDEGWGRGRGW